MKNRILIQVLAITGAFLKILTLPFFARLAALREIEFSVVVMMFLTSVVAGRI
jgi:hypothetical protein